MATNELTNSTLRERLKTYLNAKKISFTAFGETLGTSSAFVPNVKKTIGYDKLAIIYQKFPDLNLVWLLIGEGPMLIKPGTYKAEDSEIVKNLQLENAKLKDKIIDLQDAIIQLKEGFTGTLSA